LIGKEKDQRKNISIEAWLITANKKITSSHSARFYDFLQTEIK